jgi:hypothetical protein
MGVSCDSLDDTKRAGSADVPAAALSGAAFVSVKGDQTKLLAIKVFALHCFVGDESQ